jgi:hypothetical protein
MRGWIAWAACLYPAEWRRRYGAEFDALLDDASLQWRDLADVIRGALIMRMTACNSYWKVGAIAGLVGAILAGVGAFTIPDRWAVTAIMQVDRAPDDKGPPPADRREQVLRALGTAELEILGHTNLMALIQEPSLDLYQEERKRMPIEDVALQMVRRDLRVQFLNADRRDGQAFQISYSYPDRYKCRAVVQRLVADFQQQAARNPGGTVLSVVETPVLPETPYYPNRLRFAVSGLVAGTIMGLMSLKLWRRTRDYAVVTMSIPKETRQFVDTQVGPGGYASVSDYIRDLIHADEQRKSQAETEHSGM